MRKTNHGKLMCRKWKDGWCETLTEIKRDIKRAVRQSKCTENARHREMTELKYGTY